MRKILLALTACAVVATLAGATSAAPATLWKDDAGDATVADQTPDLGGFGFDLASGQIEKKGADLVFTVTHTAMPASGTLPEGFRFLWAFSVNKVGYRITAKSADIGKPDVLNGQTTERVGRVDAQGHFRLEGECKADEPVGVIQPINCKPLAYVTGTFDPAAKSFSVVIPMKLIKAKPGAVVGPGVGDEIAICTVCWITHTAERSREDTAIDSAIFSSTWKIPRK
ncbi:MAG: hypothetical protein M3345_06010 [Actinomycetota bacterium]|nr:hypothetical protein [Actinomycetota bacterium]